MGTEMSLREACGEVWNEDELDGRKHGSLRAIHASIRPRRMA